MNGKSYTFKVGEVACTALFDGYYTLDRERFMKLYPDDTEAAYRQAHTDIGLSFDKADSYFNVLALQTGAGTVLVDVGEGDRSPKGGHLLASMKQAGIAPQAVTLVVITHSHGDHVLGLLTAAGQPTFPNARYVISAPELAFWQERIAAAADQDQEAMVAMMQAKGLRVIDMDEQILPGIRAVPLPGHTPGQIALRVESGGETLFNMADALLGPIQFAHPEWSVKFDRDPAQAAVTRREALERVADEDALAMFYHLPFPGLGHVRRAAQGFTWQPLAVDG